MSWPLLISTTIALIAVDSTEATPFIWNVHKRAESQKFENADTTTTKKSEPTSQKPTSTTKKAASTSTSKKPASASSSAQPSSSAVVASSTAAITSPTSTQPPLMVVNPTANASSNAIPSSTSTTQKDTANAQSGGGISGGAIGGIVAAIIIIIAGAIAYLILRRKRNRKNAQRNMNSRMSKPDPFTMGFGSDQAFQNTQSSYQQPQMQQNNLQVNTSPYQHQYGTAQPAIAVTSPTSPSSPYYNNNGTQFHDANNHIIAGSMMPAIVPQQQPQQYQSQANQQYQPNTIYQQEQTEAHAAINDINNTLNAPANASTNNTTAVTPAAAAAAAAGAVTAGAGGASHQQQALLPPTQAGSVGVFYVAATYTPTLSDEIDIQTGDQVEILVEYDDGWCQGINLSRGNAKGVFPKHCVEYPTSESTASSEVDRVKRVSSMYIAQ
ncbi:hypothetical protein MAM1_0232c08439 [Mucor ambiguus]|uniref:SH3 domain-containing protein n=1 Tax=Mucor ambiguus TaxID=91626 RepID=A0A0C9MN71_9FUNG|nr:hypothetical protein MAM1_0232c08439 [Mucor ambiguus]